MRPLLRLLAAALAAAAPLAALAAGQDGIVSLVPGATETLFALGAGRRVVAVSSFDNWPPEVANLPRVGALLDPDLERILALRPQLVIVDPAHASEMAQLRAAGIDVYVWPTGTVGDILRGTEELAARIGSADAGTLLAAQLRDGLAAIAAAATQPRARALIVFGRRPGAFAELYVSGGVGFLHEVVEIAGGDNVFAAQPMPSFRASLEVLLADPPDVVIEARSGADAEALRREWRSLPGFGNVEVVLLDPRVALIPGPRIVESAQRVADALQRPR